MTLQIAPVARALTSASNIQRRRLCPGSARMEAGLGQEDSEYSEEGKFLHSQFMRPHSDECTPDQLEALTLAEFYADKHFEKLRRNFAVPESADYIDEREVGYWLYGASGEPVYPGHADLIRTWPRYQVRGIIDAKFGYLDVEDAADNDQLASYFVMAHQQVAVGITGVCIVQPRNFGPRITEAIYYAVDVTKTRNDLVRIVLESEKPDAPVIPGKTQCHFCKAKAKCEAYQSFAKIRYPLAVETLDNSQLERLHDAIKAAEAIQGDVQAEMRRRLADGTLPGWKLRNTGDTTTVTKPSGLFLSLKDYFRDNPNFTAKKFDECRKLEWGKFNALIKDLTGWSDKRAKAFVKDFTAPYVERIPKEKAVVRGNAPELEE